MADHNAVLMNVSGMINNCNQCMAFATVQEVTGSFYVDCECCDHHGPKMASAGEAVISWNNMTKKPAHNRRGIPSCTR